MSRPDPARLVAYEVLRAVRVDDAYANLVLPRLLRERGLSGRDAAFATELAAGTLRRRGTYDAVLDACTDRPLSGTAAKVLDALRLGSHQLLGMRVPPHAAISTTVDLVRDRAGAGPSGFANAVLRKVAARDLDAWLAEVAPDGDPAIVHSHPTWVVEAFAEALGPAGAGHGAAAGELDALLAADNEAPAVTLAARPGRVGRDELLAHLDGTPTPLSPYGVRLAGGDPGEVAAVVAGDAGVQDEGSQLVALALADAHLDGPDSRWLDLCAGPGGKAALLAGLAAGRGARLVANEVAPHRAELVRRSVRGAAPGSVEVTVADGRDGPWPDGGFDRVLLDAPCSGLGALRRRPEARWRRTPADLDDLVPLQTALLDAALRLVRPGGVVLYATCSPVLAETRDVVAGVAQRPDVRLEPLDWPDAAGPLPGTGQLWPHRHGTDAMFAALLRRGAAAAHGP